MDRGSVTLFRVRGIPVRAHWSLLLALAYATVAFSENFARLARLADEAPERVAVPALAWGALIALALFASVALHELAHSLFAVRAGGRVREITLMIVGGVSQIEKMPGSLAQEGLMALVGPLSSLAIAALLWVAHALVPRAGALADLRLGLFYLAGLNLTLGLFNLLPAFPMDGGRVLRALLGRAVGRARATRIAATLGLAMSVLFGLLGILGGNVLLVIVAFFLFGGGRAEAAAEELRQLLAGLAARDLMSRPLLVGAAETPRHAALRMQDAGRLEAVVVDATGQAVGVALASDLAGPAGAGAHVGDASHELAARMSLCPAGEPAENVLERVLSHDPRYLVITGADGAPVGLVGPTELRNAIALRGTAIGPEAPGLPHRPAAAQR